MSAVAERHIMQVVDWTKYNLEEWLYQFGAWQYSSSGTCGKSINPIAVAMDQAAKKLKQKKLTSATEQEVIANYFSDNEDNPTLNRPKQPCHISDSEARAVQRLILDIQGISDIMDDWLSAIISRYFHNKSWSDMVIRQIVVDDRGNRKEVVVYTQMDARFDVKCGLATLHCRYPFIKF